MKWAIVTAVVVSACALVACDTTAVDALRSRTLRFVGALWRKMADQRWSEAVAASGADLEIARAYVELDAEIAALQSNSSELPADLDNSWFWVKVSKDLKAVDGLYGAFVKFCRTQTDPLNVPAPVHDWLDLAQTIITEPNTSVKKALDRVDDMILHAGLYTTAMQEASPDLCSVQQSPHQLLYNMYNRVSLTEIKGYAMMQFSWMLLKLYGNGNFTQEANLMRERYEERSALMVTSMRAAMKGARRDLYRCDPPMHEEGETFVQVTQLLQGYIENEVDMNPDGTCRNNCAFYTLTKSYGCFKDQYCVRQAQCTGRIFNCQFVDSDMWVCPATQSSGRRYEWIEYENGRTLGKPGSCMRGTSKVDSWWRYLVYHCSYCMCLCEESLQLSDRFFSLRPVIADTQHNKVITGVRFTKVNRVIHLQISEGTLLPRAAIEQRSVAWRDVDAFEPDDGQSQRGVDYHALSYEQRAIDLDDIAGLERHVLTGLRLKMLGVHLHLEALVTPFNYSTGRLHPDKSQWIGNDNTPVSDKPRKLLALYKPDIPTRKFGVSYPVDSSHDQYVEFTHTDLDADAAQTTVPFIDSQPVTPAISVPLTGAGLYHRGEIGSGGFIAPKVFTYDYSPHLRADKPNNDYVIQETVQFVPNVV